MEEARAGEEQEELDEEAEAADEEDAGVGSGQQGPGVLAGSRRHEGGEHAQA